MFIAVAVTRVDEQHHRNEQILHRFKECSKSKSAHSTCTLRTTTQCVYREVKQFTIHDQDSMLSDIYDLMMI